MAYNKKKLFDQAINIIDKHKCMFIEDIVAFAPYSKTTFYDYFKIGSNELDELKERIEENRVKGKVGLRSKWYNGNNASAQIALYKLIGTKEERDILNSSEENTDNNDKTFTINFND